MFIDLIYCHSGTVFENLTSRMDRNRSFYCHRCNQQVRINLEEWQCAECQSGFVEELPAQLKLKKYIIDYIYQSKSIYFHSVLLILKSPGEQLQKQLVCRELWGFSDPVVQTVETVLWEAWSGKNQKIN